MQLLSKLAVLAAILVMHGCSAPVRETVAWPTQLPARQHFQEIYASDTKNAAAQTEEKYLAWVRRFYEGSEIYAWGFLDLESLVLRGMEGESARVLKRKLDAVGMQIGGEWAKDRSGSLVTTRMLSVWAEAIQSATTPGEVGSVVDRIAVDVAAVLSGHLHVAEITHERYGGPVNFALLDGCGDVSAELEGGCVGDGY